MSRMINWQGMRNRNRRERERKRRMMNKGRRKGDVGRERFRERGRERFGREGGREIRSE